MSDDEYVSPTEFVIQNVTTNQAKRGFKRLSEAEAAVNDHVGPDDDWTITEMPEQTGARKPVRQGRGPIR